MLTIKEYSEKKGISYEAVRKQVNRYSKELENHIIVINRKKYLDEEAIQFLDEKRNINPIIVLEINKDEQIKQLEQENKILLLKITELQDNLLQEKEQVKILQKEKIEILEEKEKKVLLVQSETNKWWEFWK